MFSVVVPAHNEERSIDACLSAMLHGAADGELEVMVVCNGCTDHTARRAAAFAPAVRVVEIAQASKTAALNVGDAAASAFPRAYVDADVQIDISALRAIVDRLRQKGCLAVVPAVRVDLDGRPWRVRAFFAVWLRLPFFVEGMASGGVYALSQEGRSRFDAFPDLIADDHYVLSLFSPTERQRCEQATSVVQAPWSLRDVTRIKTRGFIAERQLAQREEVDHRQHGGRGSFLSEVARRPRLWPAAVIYTAVNLVAEARACRRLRRGDLSWERDATSRTGGDTR